MKCKICANQADAFCKATVLGKYNIQYYACSSCRFIQTEDPYWLKEAYADAINASDVGYVWRNIEYSKLTKALLITLFDSSAKFVDYGGGYGMFARLMRDSGFDFRLFDKYCPNLFALGLEAELPGRKQYELLTAFEVFEHLNDPIAELEMMLSFSDSVFFSTELQPLNPPKPEQWWYYGLDHGQHIAFHTLRSLKIMAERFGLKLLSNGRSLHLLTKRSPSAMIFNLAVRRKSATLLNSFVRKPSLMDRDHKASLERLQRV